MNMNFLKNTLYATLALAIFSASGLTYGMMWYNAQTIF